MVFWDNMVLELLDMECGGFSISYCFRNCEDGFVWIFTGACKLVLRGEKEDFWEELGAIKDLWENLWCFGGDFNCFRFLEERRNSLRLFAEMRCV